MSQPCCASLRPCGAKNEARSIARELLQRSKKEYVSDYCVATIYTALGDNDQAFKLLESAYTERSQWLMQLKVDPRFANLRSDPRFQDLLCRIGLPTDSGQMVGRREGILSLEVLGNGPLLCSRTSLHDFNKLESLDLNSDLLIPFPVDLSITSTRQPRKSSCHTVCHIFERALERKDRTFPDSWTTVP